MPETTNETPVVAYAVCTFGSPSRAIALDGIPAGAILPGYMRFATEWAAHTVARQAIGTGSCTDARVAVLYHTLADPDLTQAGGRGWEWADKITIPMPMSRASLVVTRHPALVEYAREIGLVDDGVPVVAHATAADVRDRVVLGVLPLHLAAEARRVIEIQLEIAPEDRGRELPIERLREIAGKPVEYSVCRVDRVGVGDLDAMETSRWMYRVAP